MPSAQLENESDDTPDVNNELWLFIFICQTLEELLGDMLVDYLFMQSLLAVHFSNALE